MSVVYGIRSFIIEQQFLNLKTKNYWALLGRISFFSNFTSINQLIKIILEHRRHIFPYTFQQHYKLS